MEQAGTELGEVSRQDASSEAWRHACEARAIMALAGLSARRRQLALIEKARGTKAREQLEQTIHELKERQIVAGRFALGQIKSLVKRHA